MIKRSRTSIGLTCFFRATRCEWQELHLCDLTSVASALVCFLSTSVVTAQIDYRVDNRLDPRPGRMYEANPLVGSGGVNQRARFGFDYGPGVYSNQVISGNVSGLGRFQGQGVIPGVNQFRIGLQSDALSSFRAQSVGIQDVQRGRTFASSPYYDPSTSIADLGAIRSGLNQPGSSYLQSPNVVSSNIRGFEVRDRLLGIEDLTKRHSTRLNQGDFAETFTSNRVIAPARGAGEIDALRQYENRYRAAMQSTLFGTPSVDDRSLVPTRIGENRRLDSGPISASLRDRMMGIDVEPTRSFEDETTSSHLDSPTDSYEDMLTGIGSHRRPVGPDEAVPFGDDLFSRMTDALAAVGESGPVDGFLVRQRSDGAGGPPLNDVGGEPGTRNDRSASHLQPKSPADLNRNVDEPPTGPQITDPKSADSDPSSDVPNPRQEWARQWLKIPVRTFAMGGDASMSRYMQSAEKALKDGEFMTAARFFELAATVDHRNPLPLIGRGNALIAAGNYMSAATSIESGIRLFPEIAAFELDLVSLTGQADVFDHRRADLEKLLDVAEQYELRFLLGYIELYSGLHYDGLNDLEKAARNAPANSVIAQFPDLLLGRRPIRRGAPQP